MVGVIGLFRWSLIGGRWPGQELLVGGLVTVLLLAAGLVVFARGERRFADVI
jgi:ABC-type polysaccharide/polyol phosphate export permease